VLSACAAAGVAYASGIVLHVRPGIRAHFMPWLKQAYPWLYPRYVELYGARSHASRRYQLEVAQRFARLRLRHGLAGGEGRLAPRPRGASERQLALAL
jgi:DNA repair photolyase